MLEKLQISDIHRLVRGANVPASSVVLACVGRVRTVALCPYEQRVAQVG